MESYQHRARDPSPDWYHQPRGRDREQPYGVNVSSQGEFSTQSNFNQPQFPDRQPRRSRSADSRPQYNRGTTNNENFFDFSRQHQTSYREGNGFSASPARGSSNRPHSDVGVDRGMDSFRFHQIPKYEAVVHDDTMLYSRSERRRYRDGSSEDFLVLANKSPARSPARPGQASYNRGDPIGFVDRRHPQGQQSTYEQDRQYYNFAKENLITFGGFDAQTASTGLSQEELLQRKQREEAFNKRKEKRKTKPKNRILNFPSGLLKSNSPQRSTYSQQNEPQNVSSIYHRMSNLAPVQNNGREEDGFDVIGNVPNPNGYTSRGTGLRGSMVRRHRGKSKKTNTFTAQVPTNNRAGGSDVNYDNRTNMGTVAHGEPLNSGSRSGHGKHTMYNTDHDYLLVQRDLEHSTPHAETTPRSRGSNPRPLYADFTPKSEYTPRDLFPSKHQPHTKDTSPTSVIDAFGNSGGVRWNKNLTQQEFIITPQSTKLRPDSQLRNSSGKPKSILRSRYSASNMVKAQNGDSAMSRPFDENPQRQHEVVDRAQVFGDNTMNAFEPSSFNPDFMRDFVDHNGRDLSPIGMDHQNDINGKFPESYVHFIEAVAAVVIQTKVRQRLAKNRVQEMRNLAYFNKNAYRQEMRNRAHSNRNTYRKSEANMTPMVRKSYALARKARQANETKAARARQDIELDFYALAAIQIQAAFRGWWIRDCLGVDNYCAAMIQKTYRGSRCRREYLRDLNRVVTVQSVCRRWMAIDDAVTRIYCIVRIQAVMRGALVRKRMMTDSLEIYHAAATTIQTLWRSFWCEMTFLRAYEDILVVQSIVRGWIARKRYREKLQATSSRFSQRRKTGTRFKSSRLPSKTRNVGTYSNHVDYTKNSTVSRTTAKPETSKPQPFVVKKVSTQNSANRGSHLPWKTQNTIQNSNKGIETTKATNPNPRTNSWKKPNNNSEKSKIPSPPLNLYGGKPVSASRADIERRRKDKEQEMKAKKEEESRRVASQNAGMAELELARKKMAWKASERKEEELRAAQQSKEIKSTDASSTKTYGHGEEKSKSNESDTNDSDYFAKVRKSLKKSNTPVASSPQQDESGKVDSEKGEETMKSISTRLVVAVGGEKSLVAKRREALMTSKGENSSTTKENFSADKPAAKLGGKVDAKKEVSQSVVPTVATASKRKVQDAEIPKRDLVSSSAYQKDMQQLRSESEQKRIDYMHYIFDQAGLLSRVK